ncbi:hypothetical protein ACFQVC_22435 [Streptomyces monticola]|uniref:Serine/threonine protein kinase n=1 Tax=Streptomyces monticola TaxID=2666263 RepID=A0ABW2JNF5_9ACTN
MKRSGPLVTLLAGLLLALFMLTLNATTGTGRSSYGHEGGGGGGGGSGSPAPSSAAPTSRAPETSAPPTKTPPADADYAGRTDDGSSAVAITVRDGKAVAYFCDGRDRESWLKGDVEDDGSMRLTGKNGATLDGTLRGKRVTGSAVVGKRSYGFTADRAIKPSGLYRATQEVRGAEVDGGWIVLPSGQQVGILKRDGRPAPAPAIEPRTGAVTVDGERLTARPVTP